MNSTKKQYTIRDVPAATDGLLREEAAAYGISLNQAALQALQAGLGLADKPVVRRNLRPLVGGSGPIDHRGWKKALLDQDKVNPLDWADK